MFIKVFLHPKGCVPDGKAIQWGIASLHWSINCLYSWTKGADRFAEQAVKFLIGTFCLASGRRPHTKKNWTFLPVWLTGRKKMQQSTETSLTKSTFYKEMSGLVNGEWWTLSSLISVRHTAFPLLLNFLYLNWWVSTLLLS